MLVYSLKIENFPVQSFSDKKIKNSPVVDGQREIAADDQILCAAYSGTLHEDRFYTLHFWVGSKSDPDEAKFALENGRRYTAQVSDGGEWDYDSYKHYMVTFDVVDGQIVLVSDFMEFEEGPSCVFGRTPINPAA